MVRVKFRKGKRSQGVPLNGQKEFLDLVRLNLSSPSIRGLLQFGLSTNYSSLKNYYSERRLLPKVLFDEMVHLAKIDLEKLNVEFVEDSWGQVKGGKKNDPTQV
jgi:hypothetical protein